MMVASEIAMCVRTTRQETEHVAAKPPGSRLLGPVVVFADWLSTKESLWKLRPAADHKLSREKEKEGEMRSNLWKALCKVTSELMVSNTTELSSSQSNQSAVVIISIPLFVYPISATAEPSLLSGSP